ncbi:hypothetical protein EBU71_22960, partial [bacterium]|nr:hypothetical protein [Candidatus Elulimicrobium humile]
FNQGRNNLGGPVVTSRSNPLLALGQPQNIDIENGNINFVSLGFGGDIILKLQNKIEVVPTTTLSVYETTWNYTNCNIYAEKAEIFVSSDNSNYKSLGTTCLNSNTVFDVSQSNLDSIQYIRIVDISDPQSFSQFSFVSDGYDLDGVSVFNNGPLPIELKYFGIDFENPYLNIRIVTGSEANADKLVVESSIDASNFDFLTEFQAAGNSSFERQYDRKLIFEPESQVTYFRVVEIDFDGKKYEFDVIVVNTKKLDPIEIYYFDLLGRRVESTQSIFRLKR